MLISKGIVFGCVALGQCIIFRIWAWQCSRVLKLNLFYLGSICQTSKHLPSSSALKSLYRGFNPSQPFSANAAVITGHALILQWRREGSAEAFTRPSFYIGARKLDRREGMIQLFTNLVELWHLISCLDKAGSNIWDLFPLVPILYKCVTGWALHVASLNRLFISTSWEPVLGLQEFQKRLVNHGIFWTKKCVDQFHRVFELIEVYWRSVMYWWLKQDSVLYLLLLGSS